MPTYRFADVTVAVSPLSDHAVTFLQDYRCDSDHIEHHIMITAEDLANERALSAAPLHILEVTAVLRKLCRILLTSHDGLFLHAAAIVYRHRAYAFIAPSGTGKTTHAVLWKTALGDDVTVLNGDKLLLRRQNDRFIAYGNPWQGKEGLGEKGQYELGGMFVLTRADTDGTQPLSPVAALPHLLSATVYPTDFKSKTQLFDILDSLLCAVPTHTLRCTMNSTAVRAALSAITNGGSYED